MRGTTRFIAAVAFAIVQSGAVVRSTDDFFKSNVAPILEQKCLHCHNNQDLEGDYSLQTADAAFADGRIERDDSNSSQLIAEITPLRGQANMPKDGEPLSPRQIEVLRKWIDGGAKWPDGVELSAPEITDLDWWSLKALIRPQPPNMIKSDARKNGIRGVPDRQKDSFAKSLVIRNPIDAFVQKQLDDKGLVASPEADRRALIRRLYFDLIGLPPSPDEIAEFEGDSTPDAYERLVDRLLASKHYGERWARHWLDVVHYADTHGYDKDKLRPNAWPYRDYVIRSFNEDKPYSRFVQEQIAGDAIWPNTMDGITATGFIAAGPWDFIGHAEVPETKIDGRIARHLDRDDMVASTLNTFCSVTVQCARCHNHKFDPITQEHYYSLQSVFAALDRADRAFDADTKTANLRARLMQQQADLSAEKEELEAAVRQAAGARLAVIEKSIAELNKQKQTDAPKPEFGYHSQIAASQATTKWVQVDLGKPIAIAEVRYVGCHDDFAGIGHGFGFPLRYKIEASNDASFLSDRTTLIDRVAEDVQNPGTTPQSVTTTATARFVRFTATKLAERSNDYIFALGELMVFTDNGENVALGKSVSSLDSIEAPVRWQRKNLVDGYYFGVEAASDLPEQIARLETERDTLIHEAVSQEIRAQLDSTTAALKKTKSKIDALPPQQLVYAGTVHTGRGAFQGTGANGGKPRPIHVLHRGDILSPRKPVGPGTVPFVSGTDWRFDLPESHVESDRRVALAEWLTRRDNPLTWRSIVNRIWQYHFGRGIVDSPNDFGRMGKPPSHPKLLDWLAADFRDGDQRFKALHKLIVTSSVYRQSSAHNEHNAKIDRDNEFLWRMNRRRLSAEEIRDAVLLVSGKLNRKMGGPGFQLFVLERPEHSPHYEYHKHDPDDVESHRRSIYRFIVRSQPDPFMTTLDCADSSQSVAKRDETLTALQALSLLNNKFMLRMAEHFAHRIADEDSPVVEAFNQVAGRDPTDGEIQVLSDYAKKHGHANLCRLLFNLNEFVFVD